MQVRALAAMFKRHACASVTTRRGLRTQIERALTLSDVVRFCHEVEVHLVHNDVMAAFNNAAEFIEGRALVTPDSLERLVVNLAVLKFPDSTQDEALHLFFHHYVKEQPG